MSVAADKTTMRAARATAERRPSWAGPLRLELAKLRRQAPLVALGWLVLLSPLALVAALSVQTGTPSDTLFGRWVHQSGLAIPLVVMGFAGQWVYPVLAGVLAGDVFSGEDRHGTWKLLLTRSYGRRPVFIAKALVALVAPALAAVVLVASSLLAGLALVGRDPIIDLAGSLVRARPGSELVLLSLASQLPTLLGMAALAMAASILSRNSLVGVATPVALGLGCQLVALVDLPPLVREILPSGGFTAWRTLWTDQAGSGPIVAAVISGSVLTMTSLAVSAIVFARRDVSVR